MLGWVSTSTIQNIEIPGYGSLEFFENGLIRSIELNRNTNIIIQEINFAGTSRIEFYEDGQVKSGLLGEDATIQSVFLPAGSWVDFSSDGELTVPEGSTIIEDGTITHAEAYPFNGASLRQRDNGSFSFSASNAQDPGFSIFTNNYNLAGADTLQFEIRGNVSGYGTIVVQVYDDSATDDVTPTVEYRRLGSVITDEYSTVSIDLEGRVDNVRKIQFILVNSDSCEVRIRNIRFE